MSLAESKRFLLEEMEAIERAVAQRFKRNPALLATGDALVQHQGKKRSHRESILEQHELQFLMKRYVEHKVTVEQYNKLLKDQLLLLKDPSGTFAKFDSMLEDIRLHHQLYDGSHKPELVSSLYDIFSSMPGYQAGDQVPKRAKRKYILCRAAASTVSLENIFSEDEQCGRCLDLTKAYLWYESNSSEPVSYVEFLSQYDNLPDSSLPAGSGYASYVNELYEYLVSFVHRAKPFEKKIFTEVEDIVAQTKESEPELTQEAPKGAVDGSANEAGEVFCKACDKWFTKETVYKGHLTGKKHLKNLKNLDNGESSSGKSTAKMPNTGFNVEHHIDVLEQRIKRLGQFLANERLATISNVERRATISEREALLEKELVREEEEELTDIQTDEEASQDGSEGSDDEDESGFKHLPVGADGQPMPFWLYKLQGYHKSYSCEICGDITYKGRIVFTKHFTSPKHQQGLKMLGITDESLSLFKNITKIDEAIDLWRKMKKDHRTREGDTENAIEVEDAEGNVMSRRDYEELKRQGLL